jgi:hypothetical protein
MLRKIILTLAMLALAVPLALAQNPGSGAGKPTPCSLVTQADVREAVGTTVTGPQPNKVNPAVCDFKVGDMGSVGVMLNQGAGQTPDQVIAGLKKSNIATSDAPGVGDRSFFASPGYGTVQLNTFKGAYYVIVTVLVPGVPDAKAKAIATAVMQKAIARF